MLITKIEPSNRQGAGWEVVYAAVFLISNESSCANAHTAFPTGESRRHCAGLGCEILIAGGLPPATAMHKSSLPAISTESTHEHADQTLRALQAWPDHAA